MVQARWLWVRCIWWLFLCKVVCWIQHFLQPELWWCVGIQEDQSIDQSNIDHTVGWFSDWSGCHALCTTALSNVFSCPKNVFPCPNLEEKGFPWVHLLFSIEVPVIPWFLACWIQKANECSKGIWTQNLTLLSAHLLTKTNNHLRHVNLQWCQSLSMMCCCHHCNFYS